MLSSDGTVRDGWETVDLGDTRLYSYCKSMTDGHCYRKENGEFFRQFELQHFDRL